MGCSQESRSSGDSWPGNLLCCDDNRRCGDEDPVGAVHHNILEDNHLEVEAGWDDIRHSSSDTEQDERSGVV